MFFSSPNCVDFFFAQPWSKAFLSTKKIAVLSGGTKNRLQQHGFIPNFEGSSTDSTSKIAAQFFGSNQIQHVLFVIGNQSLKKVQQQANCPFSELIVYKNTLLPIELKSAFNCYIFSSPSNVQAFFAMNTLPKNAKLIAFGESTKNELKQFTNQSITQLYAYTNEAILDAI